MLEKYEPGCWICGEKDTCYYTFRKKSICGVCVGLIKELE
jgi:hypothetical protein